MKTANYEKTEKTNSYSEIYQSSGVEFSIVKREGGINKQISPFFKCRDFLSDAFWAIRCGEPVQIYGFSHPPNENFLRGRLRFLVKFPASGALSLEKGWELLKRIEKDMNIPQSRAFKTSTKGVYLVSAAKFWGQNPAMISFITFILRQGVNLVKYNLEPDPEKFFTQETHGILKDCTDKHTTEHFAGYDKIKELLSSQADMTKTFNAFLGKLNPKNRTHVSRVHNQTGISSILGGVFEKAVKTTEEGK